MTTFEFMVDFLKLLLNYVFSVFSKWNMPVTLCLGMEYGSYALASAERLIVSEIQGKLIGCYAVLLKVAKIKQFKCTVD